MAIHYDWPHFAKHDTQIMAIAPSLIELWAFKTDPSHSPLTLERFLRYCPSLRSSWLFPDSFFGGTL